ncbi:NotI family restriction endonuclease [Oceanibaculum indicum]|uniref:Restriction endonuclease NotI n=1 Tax=Oceanibaculum indicum TaxID=526216 RepID=A0A420WNA2_9PROT|nr:NotI family restriction endonuclease [Oceanibaculum indicum]RKQ72497.1 restriction endonuclease NotI [Oceanibaculum indicum]
MVLNMPKDKRNALRFGIGEWYGKSFADMDDATRLAYANFKADKGARLKKTERERLAALEIKGSSGILTAKEAARLAELRVKKANEVAGNKLCPFKGLNKDAICTKEGGVCSLRLYEKTDNGAVPIEGERGSLRALCPYRFHEQQKIFHWAGRVLLGDKNPGLVGEVGFLESSESVDGVEGDDVGRIDMVLVKSGLPDGYPMQWAALEIQAVYFSGSEMGKEFKEIRRQNGTLTFPKEVRRPDYRSSGPKRLMPQLQIKVPTLRRWGKKMAVVVDRSFFNSMGRMEAVGDLSNSDIAWFLVDFEKTSKGDAFKLVAAEVVFTTLERAIEGLTGGSPVPLSEFEQRIAEKLN